MRQSYFNVLVNQSYDHDTTVAEAQDIQKKAADFLQTQLPEMTAQIVSSLESLSFQVGEMFGL